MASTQDPVNETEWPATARMLKELLPPTLQSLTDSESDATSSFWTPTEIAEARLRSIQQHLQRGWKYEDGWLIKGTQKARPSELVPYKAPGDVGYNPDTDAWAVVRLGAVHIGHHKYRLGTLTLNHMGQCLDPSRECMSCGSVNKEHAFMRQTWGDDPTRPWLVKYTWCRRCYSRAEVEAMIEDSKRRVAATPPGRR
jgi:hypothetical protein